MTTLKRNFTAASAQKLWRARGANGGNGGGNQNLCSLRPLAIYRSSLLFKSGPGGVVELDFDKSISDGVNMNPESFFLACCAGVGRRRKSAEGGPALHSLGDGGREYKAVYVQNDAEIGLFSDEVVVNCAP